MRIHPVPTACLLMAMAGVLPAADKFDNSHWSYLDNQTSSTLYASLSGKSGKFGTFYIAACLGKDKWQNPPDKLADPKTVIKLPPGKSKLYFNTTLKAFDQVL